MELVMKFYTQETLGQIHKIIGSADFLGNPVGLFNNITSGASDFFYEPFEGFEITRPEMFGIGLVKVGGVYMLPIGNICVDVRKPIS